MLSLTFKLNEVTCAIDIENGFVSICGNNLICIVDGAGIPGILGPQFSLDISKRIKDVQEECISNARKGL